jgi:hypothetical protein
MAIDGEVKARIAGDGNQSESVANIAPEVKTYSKRRRNRTPTVIQAEHSRWQGEQRDHQGSDLFRWSGSSWRHCGSSHYRNFSQKSLNLRDRGSFCWKIVIPIRESNDGIVWNNVNPVDEPFKISCSPLSTSYKYFWGSFGSSTIKAPRNPSQYWFLKWLWYQYVP